MYRVLVSRDTVPLWQRPWIKGLAVHQHLYTRTAAGELTDEAERWFEQQFESPATAAVEKAVTDQRLTPADWNKLIRLLAAQDVRTPARLMETLRRWNTELPSVAQETLGKAVDAFTAAKRKGVPLPQFPDLRLADFPARVTIDKDGHPGGATVKVNLLAGRALWLFQLRHLLTHTVEALARHRWTILRAPAGMQWVTSDDPVVRLNYGDAEHYDFRGGWGSRGTEIFFPLGPDHLMYTRIGEKPPQRGHVLSRSDALGIQKFIIEHAHWFVIAASRDPYVATTRPRHVDEDAYRAEAAEWAKWHAEQTSAEREFGA
jgi:hypothetical protein